MVLIKLITIMMESLNLMIGMIMTNICSDLDDDSCDDCNSGSFDISNDGLDFDGDGICDAGDVDDDMICSDRLIHIL